LKSDWLPGLGLAVASFATSIMLYVPLEPLLRHSRLVNKVGSGHVPSYYVIYALVLFATTAITEEVVINGYLLIRLEQLNWTPRSALILSLGLRTSYHVYYGLAVVFTLPLGYYVTRSFQKRRRLTRAITTHFLYDAALTTIAS
jgi:membrane protease YdiL (CAAX protease family)